MKTTSLTARTVRVSLDGVGDRWFGGHRVATHLSNALHMLFPAGERFFVRSVMAWRGSLPSELAERVKGFCRQEGHHARAHETYFTNLRAQGHDVDAMLARYEHLAFAVFEPRASPKLRLAVTAALEHYTAILSADALSRNVLAGSDAEMQKLLRWHCVEELEHKAVAFDVLRFVAPSYTLRASGFVIASLALFAAWAAFARALLRKEGIGIRDALRALREPGAPPALDLRTVLRGALAYLRPGFHPDEVDHRVMVERTLRELTREGAFG